MKKIKKNLLKKSKKIKNKCGLIYRKLKKKIFPSEGFTLSELLITITILIVLTTVAFISVTGFIKKARDAARFETLNRMDFAIQLFKTEKGIYPKPEKAAEIVFSGGLLWTQGTFGDNVRRNVRTVASKPVDVMSENEFAYSLANDGQQYELGAVWEANVLSFDGLIGQVYANGKIPVKSMVVGNYNGLTLSVGTGGLLYVLSLPTILSYDTTETDIIKLIDKKTLAYKGYGNIASAYENTVFKIDGGFDFDPSILVIYAGTQDNLINNESEWIQLIDNLQESYSGSLLEGDTFLNQILATEIDMLNPTKEVRELAYEFVTEQLNIILPVILTSGPNWLTYDLSNSLIDNDTRSITQDSALNMWFATKNGVSTFIGNTWGSYAEADGLVNKDVRTVIQADSGDMWFATNKGVSVFDGTIWTTYDEGDGLIDDDVVDLIEDSNGDFWFATKKGVSKFDGITWTDYKTNDGIADKVVTGIIEGPGGKIWISTVNGVSRFNGSVWHTYRESDGLVNKNVLSIEVDNSGNIWFGTINGVSKFNGSWTNYNESDGLIDKYVNDIFADSYGNIWFSTMAGASKFDGITWTDYTTDDGLADNDVQVIYQDIDGNIWFGTKKGITIYFK